MSEAGNKIQVEYARRKRRKRTASSAWVLLSFFSKTNIFGGLMLVLMGILLTNNESFFDFPTVLIELLNAESYSNNLTTIAYGFVGLGIGRIILGSIYQDVEEKEKNILAIILLLVTGALNVWVSLNLNNDDFDAFGEIAQAYVQAARVLPYIYLVFKVYTLFFLVFPVWRKNKFAQR